MPPGPRSDFAGKGTCCRIGGARVVDRHGPKGSPVTPQMHPSWLEAVGDELETPALQELRAFLVGEVAGRPRLLPSRRPRLQRPSADAARRRPRRDPRPGPLPRARPGDGALLLGPGRRHAAAVAAQHLHGARHRPRPAAAELRRSDALGGARRPPPEQRPHGRPGLARLARGQGLGAVHRPGDRGALGARARGSCSSSGAATRSRREPWSTPRGTMSSRPRTRRRTRPPTASSAAVTSPARTASSRPPGEPPVDWRLPHR